MDITRLTGRSAIGAVSEVFHRRYSFHLMTFSGALLWTQLVLGICEISTPLLYPGVSHTAVMKTSDILTMDAKHGQKSQNPEYRRNAPEDHGSNVTWAPCRAIVYLERLIRGTMVCNIID